MHLRSKAERDPPSVLATVCPRHWNLGYRTQWRGQRNLFALTLLCCDVPLPRLLSYGLIVFTLPLLAC